MKIIEVNRHVKKLNKSQFCLEYKNSNGQLCEKKKMKGL